MNFLFWAFLAGSATIAFPLVFHLIRRTPRGKQTFSSLMFLAPTPPRLTRRSRLDDLLLLFLRAMVILLLAAAFMRPYWRSAANMTVDGVRGRRIAVILDTSASMRRGDLWSQAQGRVGEVLDDLRPGDDIALYAFDRSVRTLIGFDKDMPADPGQKPALIRGKLKELGPAWHATDLGMALITVAEALDEIGDQEPAGDALQIVVIGDLQLGADLSSLEAFEWPQHVQVDIRPVALPDNSNAHLQLLAASEEDGPDADPKVRVINAEDSTIDQFTVSWATEKSREGDEGIAFYVPPGQSRVLGVPRSAATMSADRLQLHGDEAVFDNLQFVVPLRQQVYRVAYLGSDNNADGPLHYLDAAFAETPQRRVDITTHKSDETLAMLPGELPHVVVVADAVSDAQQGAIESYVQSGGTALVLLTRGEIAASLKELMAGVEPIDSASTASTDYRMLGAIDFSHPLFAVFANPRYNDFTNIRFWRHQPFSLPDDPNVHVVARFDNDQPAFWQQTVGDGKLLVLTSGWQPSSSQLALSNKFVPLLEGVLQQSTRGELETDSYRVGDPVPLPAEGIGSTRSILMPDGTSTPIGSDAASFDGTDQPGIYTLSLAGEELAFAVNMRPTESDTSPLAVEQLEQRGVQLGTHASREEEAERIRQLRDTELENRQKLWKWFVVAALVFVGLEMCLSGWRARQSNQASGEAE